MAEPLTDAQLVAIEDRARHALVLAVGATPGPWRAGNVAAEGKVWAPHAGALEGPHGERCLLNMNTRFPHTDDRAFIAASRTLVPQITEDVARLLHEVRRLQKIETAARACLAADETYGSRAPTDVADWAMGTRVLNRVRHALRCALPIEKVPNG